MSEPTRRAEIRVSEDKESVAVEFLPASGVTGTLNLNVEELSRLIAALGAARQVMVAGKPMPTLEGVEMQAIINTRWYIQPEPLTEGSLLSFYHTSFGPVAFVVPRDQVEKIVRLLTVHLDIPPVAAGRPN